MRNDRPSRIEWGERERGNGGREGGREEGREGGGEEEKGEGGERERGEERREREIHVYLKVYCYFPRPASTSSMKIIEHSNRVMPGRRHVQ